MQEEVENRTLTLVVSGTKFTGRCSKLPSVSTWPTARRRSCKNREAVTLL
mgnify:FL=1